MKSFEELKDLSIVVTTVDRPEMLRRCVEYWRRMPSEVVVVDGSKDPVSTNLLQTLGSSWRYLHLPGEVTPSASNNSFIRRLNLGLEMASRSYVAICPDDDFFLPSGLVDCIEQLRAGVADLVTGMCIGFRNREDAIDWSWEHPLKRTHWFARSQRPLMRSAALHRRPIPHYGVMKRDFARKLLEVATATARCAPDSRVMMSWFADLRYLLPWLLARHHHVDSLLWVRERISKSPRRPSKINRAEFNKYWSELTRTSLERLSIEFPETATWNSRIAWRWGVWNYRRSQQHRPVLDVVHLLELLLSGVGRKLPTPAPLRDSTLPSVGAGTEADSLLECLGRLEAAGIRYELSEINRCHQLIRENPAMSRETDLR